MNKEFFEIAIASAIFFFVVLHLKTVLTAIFGSLVLWALVYCLAMIIGLIFIVIPGYLRRR